MAKNAKAGGKYRIVLHHMHPHPWKLQEKKRFLFFFTLWQDVENLHNSAVPANESLTRQTFN